MLDLGLTKLAIIGVVALVVVGPERLPKVARTVGTLLGRAQRYLADVKAEVNREMQIDELRSMRDSVHKAASSFESSLREGVNETEADLNASFNALSDEPMTSIAPPGDALAQPFTPLKRRNFRHSLTQRQSATPLWFKSASRKRTRVLSGAARVARYRRS